MSFRQILQRIGHKDWQELLDLWLNFLPQIQFPITDNLPSTSEIPSLEEAKEKIGRIEANSTVKEHHFNIEGLHVSIFLEAVYLFYKSLNVLKSAQSNVLNGFKTWSVTTSYQASYFALKCFLDIVGIHSMRIENKNLLIDLYPSYRNLPKREVEIRRKGYEVQIQLTTQLSHYEFWDIFQRVLRISENLPLEKPIIDLLSSLNSTDFARQRNSIIYYNTRWLFSDLKEPLIEPDFGVKKVTNDEEPAYGAEDDLFTTVNAFLLLRLNYRLFSEIAKVNPNFEQEFVVLASCMEDSSNSLFHRFTELQC